MVKKKKIIISIFLAGLLAIASSSLAATRASWPDTPAGHPFPDQGIPELVRYFYEWGISLGGLLVFVALLIAGFQYMSSTGNPAMMQEAKERIKSAFWGLVLLLGSWLILNTINPQFTHFPELVLDLSKLAEASKQKVGDVSPYPCEFAYVYGEKNYAGRGGYMKPGELIDEKHDPSPKFGYRFDNNVDFDEPLSVLVWRSINCSGHTDPSNTEYDYEKDELILPIFQAIAECQNDILAEMGPAEILAGVKPECPENKIIELVEDELKKKYTFIDTEDPNRAFIPSATQMKDPVTSCNYNLTEESFGIEYNISIPKYYISDGNCTFQLHKRQAFIHGCGERLSDVYGSYPDITEFIDDNIECIRLIATSEDKDKK